MGWNRVNERLPDDDQIVLVHAPDATEPVWLGFHHRETESWVWAEGADILEKVTHWMEIPEVPKG